MPKYIELSADETISTAELFGNSERLTEICKKEEPNDGSDQELCKYDAD